MPNKSRQQRARKIPSWQKIHPDLISVHKEWATRLLLASKEKSKTAGRRKAHLPNVVGLGIGTKVSAESEVKKTCLRFLVHSKKAHSKLSKNQLIPATINGFPTDVVEIGKPIAFSGNSIPHPQHSPIRPGCSIGYATDATDRNAGTLSAFVKDSEGVYLLSCNHVLMKDDVGASDPAIVHPGSLDEADSMVTVAKIARSEPLSTNGFNSVDCAIAILLPALVQDVDYSVESDFFNSDAGTSYARKGMLVEMTGRSGYYTGRVVETSQSVVIKYERGDVALSGQVEIQGVDGEFGIEGDSGALILEKKSKSVIGMLVGGTTLRSYATPINEALDRLGVTLV